MTRSEDVLAAKARAALDERLRALDEAIAGIELPDIPHPRGTDQKPSTKAVAEIHSLLGQVDEQRARLEAHMREQGQWLVEAERAVRDNDDERAKDALHRYGEHTQAVMEAEAMLTEFRALVTELRRTMQRSADDEQSPQSPNAG